MLRLSPLCLLLIGAAAFAQPAGKILATAAAGQAGVTTIYDPSYVRLAYPGGDLPIQRGVCTDVIIRAFRRIGVDLQREVHEDMKRNFRAYPQLWGLRGPDPNIDHRRVPNLMRYFERKGKKLRESEFKPGDIVAWRLASGNYHIGIIGDRRVPGTTRNYVVHNIGQGTKSEDILYAFRLLAHYRW